MASIYESNNYKELIFDENWSQSIQIELIALMKTNTWKFVPLPKHKRLLDVDGLLNSNYMLMAM